MFDEKKKDGGQTTTVDDHLSPIPLDQREKWISPAVVFGGLEFSTSVMIVGATLVGTMGFKGMIPVILFTFLCITWPGNAISGYIGAKTGLSSSVIARQSFGEKQAKFIIALIVGIMCMGWWAVQTSITGNALCALLGIDYLNEKVLWGIVTIVVGVVFATPAIIGYSSMKWTDYLAVPGGLLLCIVGIYLALKNVGLSNIINYEGDGSMPFTVGVATLLGMNISQFVISADYTRFAKPTVRDNVIIPWGIIGIGIPLVFIGAIMAAGQGTADIVIVMQQLGFPVWGFIVLWLAAWTSQLVNNYTMGLSFANLLNITSEKGRSWVTIGGTVLALILCLLGILDHFTDFLNFSSLLYPGIAGVIFVDFFARKQNWEDKKGWNFMATIGMLAGVATGYYTTYVNNIGIPAVQSLFVTMIVYYVAMRIKASVAPDHFTEGFCAKEL